MARVNTVSWQDGVVLTKLIGELQGALMDWQMYAYGVVTARRESGPIGGDSNVLVGAIRLRDRLNGVIDLSAKAQRGASVDRCACTDEGL